MKQSFWSLCALSWQLCAVLSHMSMQFPYPRDLKNGVSYAVWEQNEPMWSVHPDVCHGLDEDTTVRTGNAFQAGDYVAIDIYGSAPHNGGHCAFWWTTNPAGTWYKIIDIVDCTILDSFNVMLPYTMDVACQSKCTFAFTWVPFSSGACEIYMNCAEISVGGVTGLSATDTPITLSFQNLIDTAGCQRVDDNTHWTTIFNTLKTAYTNDDSNGGTVVIPSPTDAVDTPSPTTAEPTRPNETPSPTRLVTSSPTEYVTPSPTRVVGVDEEDLDEDIKTEEGALCSNPDAPYLDGTIDYSGRCGQNCVYASCRCDEGQCCSVSGYCGPEATVVNGETKYINYDTNPPSYYESEAEAMAPYCDNNQGDWRLVTCESLGYVPRVGTPSPTSEGESDGSSDNSDDTNGSTDGDDAPNNNGSGNRINSIVATICCSIISLMILYL